jgi:hypothetical protein
MQGSRPSSSARKGPAERARRPLKPWDSLMRAATYNIGRRSTTDDLLLEHWVETIRANSRRARAPGMVLRQAAGRGKVLELVSSDTSGTTSRACGR